MIFNMPLSRITSPLLSPSTVRTLPEFTVTVDVLESVIPSAYCAPIHKAEAEKSALIARVELATPLKSVSSAV